jgi:hypothetical protein
MCQPRPRDIRSYRIGNLARWVGGILGRVLSSRLCQGEHFLSLNRYPLGNIFLLEVRNFLGRIELLYSKCVWAGVSLGPCYQETLSGCLVPNIRTGENTRRIEQLKATYPWTTLVDQHILLATQSDQEQSTTLDFASCILKRTRTSHRCSFETSSPTAPVSYMEAPSHAIHFSTSHQTSATVRSDD